MSTRDKLLAAMEVLSDAIEDLTPVVEEVAGPTVEEIGENVSGNPNLFYDNPDLYAKMSKYYNPNKQPFTSTTWMQAGMLGFGESKSADGYLRDTRPYKVTEVDGKPYQRTNPKAGPDFYWIGYGVSDVTAPEWNAKEVDYTATKEQKLENIRNYQGGLRSSVSGWPVAEREAYKSTH